jgi:hypothetical protein
MILSAFVTHKSSCAFFPGLICIRTNGNALGLIVQVHGVSQHDDSNAGGTEHGGVPGLVLRSQNNNRFMAMIQACTALVMVTLCSSLDW